MANANDIAKNAMSSIQSGGQALTDAQKQQQALEEQRRQQTADYLNNIEDPMAQGQGGYSADEASAIQDTAGLSGLNGQYGAISSDLSNLYNPDSVSPSADFLAGQQLTPQQQQDIVTGAGITAGRGAQAAKDAVGRAVAATGGNPMALATYRARLDRQGAGDAADAMTQSRINASNTARSAAANAEQMREQGGQNTFSQGSTIANEKAGIVGQQAGLENEGSTRAGTVANTRLGTQQNALQYYQGQNQQADTDAQNAQNRQQQTYQTQTGGTTSAANTGVNASQTPSTFDKIIGGVGGALSFLEDGDYLSGGMDAIVGEDGPEKVVQAADLPLSSVGMDHGVQSQKAQPFWKRLQQNMSTADRSVQPGQQPAKWSKVDTYSTLGKLGGGIARSFMEDGGFSDTAMAAPSASRTPFQTPGSGSPAPVSFRRRGSFMADGGIITQPTRVRLAPGEAVVPLDYRPGAKMRPSMAALPAVRTRQPFGAARA